jgi:aminodeoxyfutalosine synthase
MNRNSIQTVLCESSLDSTLRLIAEKVEKGERISNEDCIYLYEKAPLGYLGTLANYIREQKHGDNTFFNRNFHVEPTNVCVYTCTFCAYSRLIKNRDEGWELSIEQILDSIKKYDGQPVTEVHITGGVVPKQNFDFYTELFRSIKNTVPNCTSRPSLLSNTIISSKKPN